jgi:hypothetical protein
LTIIVLKCRGVQLFKEEDKEEKEKEEAQQQNDNDTDDKKTKSAIVQALLENGVLIVTE